MSKIINLHPDAIKNFNQKAVELLKLITVVKSSKKPEDFKSELPSSMTINSEDIIGDVWSGTVNYKGEVASLDFHIDGKHFELNDDNTNFFHSLAQTIKKHKEIKYRFGIKFIEEKLYEWLATNFSNSDFAVTWCDFLINEGEKKIQNISTWIPIANLEISVPIKIANSEICSLTPELFQKWQTMLLDEQKKIGEETELHIFERLKIRYMGRAAVITHFEAEPSLVNEMALNKAKRYTSIFSIYSGATKVPDFKCSCKVKGSENLDSFSIISKNSNNLAYKNELIDKASAMPWQLTTREIQTIKKHSLNTISDLLNKNDIKGFELTVLNFVELYSKAAFTNEPLEKLVFVLSALESTLLKGSEHIQSNLADRVAMFLGESPTQKKKYVEIVKDVYDSRSSYLHHGVNEFDFKKLQIFFELIWDFFSKLIKTFDQFDSKMNFLNHLDNLKYS